MNKVVWHQGSTGTAKTFELNFHYRSLCHGQQWIENPDKASLRRQMRDYRPYRDELVFDNLYPTDFGDVFLPTSEFLKLTDKSTKTWRGFRTSCWETVRFSSIYSPDKVFPELGDAAWERIDVFVYHYFKDATSAWGFKEFQINGVKPDLAELEREILEEVPTAIFRISDLMAAGGDARNYAYGCQRLDEMGIRYKKNPNGSFVVGDPDNSIIAFSFIFDDWSRDVMRVRYHKDAEVLVIDEHRKDVCRTLYFPNVSRDDFDDFQENSDCYERFDAEVAYLLKNHTAMEIPYGNRPPEWYRLRGLDDMADSVENTNWKTEPLVPPDLVW